MADLAELHLDLVYGHAARLRTLVGPRADHDELVGDGMVALVKARNLWAGPDDEFRHWATVVVRNGMVDGLRRRWGRNFSRAAMDSLDRRVSDVEGGDATLGDMVPDPRADLVAIVEARERLVEFALSLRPRAGAPGSLSAQEMEALAGAALGESNAETGRRLRRATETVKSQRASVLRKLGARNMAQAVYVAMRDDRLVVEAAAGRGA